MDLWIFSFSCYKQRQFVYKVVQNAECLEFVEMICDLYV